MRIDLRLQKLQLRCPQIQLFYTNVFNQITDPLYHLVEAGSQHCQFIVHALLSADSKVASPRKTRHLAQPLDRFCDAG